MASNDIPLAQRGTVRFGDKEWHYMRSDKTGQLFIVAGPDPRDWSKIASGALDYAHIAFQEHQAWNDNDAKTLSGKQFPGHDGQKAAAACEICAQRENRQPVQEYVVPAEVPADVQAQNDQLAAQQAEMDAQAARDAAQKALIPPSREVRDDQAKQAKMDARQAELDAQEQRLNQLLQKLEGVQVVAAQSTGTAVTGATEPTVEIGGQTMTQGQFDAARHPLTAPDPGPVTGAADPQQNAGVLPTDPDVIAGARDDIKQAALDARPDLAPQVAASTPEQVQDPTTGDRPEYGLDPWTKEKVKIFWNIDGADADHPYGKKKDGTPRRPVGRKAEH